MVKNIMFILVVNFNFNMYLYFVNLIKGIIYMKICIYVKLIEYWIIFFFVFYKFILVCIYVCMIFL